MSSKTYSTHVFPRHQDPISPSNVTAYRAICLYALKESPSSFQASYDHDASLSLEQWAARLQHPLANVLVCTAHASSIPPEQRTLENGEWVGKMLLVGQLTRDDFLCALGDTAEAWSRGGTNEIRFFWRGFYMRPEVRGGEAVVVMLQGMLDFLRDGAVDAGVDWARIRGQMCVFFYLASNPFAVSSFLIFLIRFQNNFPIVFFHFGVLDGS
jgi:hypothetical protein